MKSPVSPHTVAFLLALAAPLLHAQNLKSNDWLPKTSLSADAPSPNAISGPAKARFRYSPYIPGSREVPALEKVKGTPPEEAPVISPQNPLNLDESNHQPRDVASVVDLDILRQPSPYSRKIRVSKPYEIEPQGLENGLKMLSAIYRKAGAAPDEPGCASVGLSVSQKIKLEPSRALEIVEFEVASNPGCACEIVKAAISATASTPDDAASIVEAAILAEPDSMRIVSQCAIATMPESISAVQHLLTLLDPNAGESGHSAKGAKSAKSAKEAAPAMSPPPLPNPLDLPPSDPPLPPPPIVPPVVTDVNPS